MFEKNLGFAYLIDFYGEALPSHTREIMKMYYEDDLSLAEIAASEGISRQGVRHIIKKGEDELQFLEGALGLAAHYSELTAVASRLKDIALTLREKKGEDFSEISKSLEEDARIILSKN